MDGTGTRGTPGTGVRVQDTLREMWETRPTRPREGRRIAGVAAAVARRYDVDPVLVRVGFVVAAFGGIGFWLYVAGALALPGERKDGTTGRDLRPHTLIALAVIGFFALTGVFFGDDGPGWGGSGILAGLLALGLLVLLHRSRGDRPAVAPQAPADPADPAVSLVKGAPAWDPLGAAPFAWDLPEPAAPPAPPAPKRPPVTAVTLALALLAGGATALLQLALGVFGPGAAPVLLGVVLAVVGAGLVVGSFLRAGRGLVPVAVVVGLVTWGALAAPAEGWWRDADGLEASPASAAQVAATYSRDFGDIDLDLSRIDLSTGTGPVRTEVTTGAGEVRITVPEDADLTLNASTGAGEVSFDDEVRSGVGQSLVRTNDLGEDGVASGRSLQITVRAGVGDVEVSRD
jgi:phage shock protein PspC (stress-responsive transcriptional regulator)